MCKWNLILPQAGAISMRWSGNSIGWLIGYSAGDELRAASHSMGGQQQSQILERRSESARTQPARPRIRWQLSGDLNMPLTQATRTRISPRLALPLILFAYLIAGALYATSAPFLEVSNEARHYAMVEHLAQGNELPIQDALK